MPGLHDCVGALLVCDGRVLLGRRSEDRAWLPGAWDVIGGHVEAGESAEAALRRLGFSDFRVRHHGDIARIELPAEDLPRAVTEPLRGAVLDAVRAAGFRFVTADLAGVQSGAFTLPLVVAAGD